MSILAHDDACHVVAADAAGVARIVGDAAGGKRAPSNDAPMVKTMPM
jgi:hypothetical protein